MQPVGEPLSVYVAVLIRKFLVAKLTEEEYAELTEWIDEDLFNKELFIRTVKIYKEDIKLNNTPEKPNRKPSAKKEIPKVSTLEGLLT